MKNDCYDELHDMKKIVYSAENSSVDFEITEIDLGDDSD